jgi:5'-3' exonuclease
LDIASPDKSNVVCAIDSGNIVYTVSYRLNQKYIPEHKLRATVIENVRAYISSILSANNTYLYVGFIDYKSFRRKIEGPIKYKGKRDSKETPDFILNYGGIVKEVLENEFGFYKFAGLEADDCVTLVSTFGYPDKQVIVCSNDKDLKQVPCRYYDIQKNAFYEVNEIDAFVNLWVQMLMGDSADSIPGITGTYYKEDGETYPKPTIPSKKWNLKYGIGRASKSIGEVKANQIIRTLMNIDFCNEDLTPKSYEEILKEAKPLMKKTIESVKEMYSEVWGKELGEEFFMLNYVMLKLLTADMKTNEYVKNWKQPAIINLYGNS